MKSFITLGPGLVGEDGGGVYGVQAVCGYPEPGREGPTVVHGEVLPPNVAYHAAPDQVRTSRTRSS